MKILKCTDIIRLTVESESPISVFLKPLSVAEKIDIASKVKMVKGEEIADYQAQAFLCIKYSLVKIEGVETYDGEIYEPTIIDGKIEDSSVDDIVNMLSEVSLILPYIQAANKNLSSIKGVKVDVNPK